MKRILAALLRVTHLAWLGAGWVKAVATTACATPHGDGKVPLPAVKPEGLLDDLRERMVAAHGDIEAKPARMPNVRHQKSMQRPSGIRHPIPDMAGGNRLAPTSLPASVACPVMLKDREGSGAGAADLDIRPAVMLRLERRRDADLQLIETIGCGVQFGDGMKA
jgi:hypothetical protein